MQTCFDIGITLVRQIVRVDLFPTKKLIIYPGVRTEVGKFVKMVTVHALDHAKLNLQDQNILWALSLKF